MTKLQRSLKTKTMWLALALAVFGAVETQLGAMADVIPSPWFGVISILVSSVTAVLRVLTMPDETQ